jgi:hypothetical protein
MQNPVTFEVDQSVPTTLTVTASDGKRYEVKMAMLVQAVVETGQVNPLDQMPIFNVVSQVLSQTKLKTDA